VPPAGKAQAAVVFLSMYFSSIPSKGLSCFYPLKNTSGLTSYGRFPSLFLVNEASIVKI
jgi:hypothetical protein